MILKTKRLLLRPVVPEDASDIYYYSRQQEVGTNAGWSPHQTLQETEMIMHTLFVDNPLVFALTRASDGQLMGTIGFAPDTLRPDTGLYMLGYAIGKEWWGKGYTTEAAQQMVRHAFVDHQMEFLAAYSYPENIGSIRVLEKCGFMREGTLRYSEKHFSGKMMDTVCFSMTKQEFSKQYTY